MVTGLAARARSLWRGLRRPERLEAEMDEEMRFHIEMEAERLARERGDNVMGGGGTVPTRTGR